VGGEGHHDRACEEGEEVSITIADYRKLIRKRPRYTAKRGMVDDIRFGSQRELRRYKDLKVMQAGGVISDLKIHPRYDLHVNGVLLGFAEIDFEYWCHCENRKVYEDVKDRKKNTSTRTPIFRWKAKHLLAEHGITVREVE
jgi:hypothetical protein